MNYDTIIVELLARIQKLEEEVGALQQAINYQSNENASSAPSPKLKITTKDIRLYIEEQKTQARDNGQTELILKANDIHRSLKLQSRMSMVCNAMRQCMSDSDVVLHDTASGCSSTVEIKYYLLNN